MRRGERIFGAGLPAIPSLTWEDAAVLMLLAALLAGLAGLALHAPAEIRGPAISLHPAVLPYYALLSLRRLLSAFVLSLVFALAYGRAAARSRRAERVYLPLLDILQSIPLLSFLPVVLLSMAALLPQRPAAELSSILLVFTSQAWNLAFAWYQALTTLPTDLSEASAMFRFSPWLRFRAVELPFAARSLIWNGVMSMAGGWFFLMAAEMFTVNGRDFRLPGLGSYLQQAAFQGDTRALWLGLLTLVIIIVLFDQLVWQPLLAWAERFRLDATGSDEPSRSWLFNLVSSSRLMRWFFYELLAGLTERIDALVERARQRRGGGGSSRLGARLGSTAIMAAGTVLGVLGVLYCLRLLVQVTPQEWLAVAAGLAATLGRVALALLLAVAWTLPAGIAIGQSPRLASWLQPLVQIAASVPATALFPVLVLVLLRLPGGINLAAVLLMLLGTQWYLLFNVIAGASAIPQDLNYTSTLIHLRGLERLRVLTLPALFPYIITGAITASGGAWNASIVAEYQLLDGRVYSTPGAGSLISQATAAGRYPLLLAVTLCMVLAVIMINKFVWRRLYRLAASRYKLE